MEGMGSRQSRASSRYASNPSAPPVFNGPVRKWKKQWVSSQSNNQSNGNNLNTTHTIVLCRWTPLSSTAAATDEPRKRRFRYTPVVPIERGDKDTLHNEPNTRADMLKKLSTGEEALELGEETTLVEGSSSSYSEGKTKANPKLGTVM